MYEQVNNNQTNKLAIISLQSIDTVTIDPKKVINKNQKRLTVAVNQGTQPLALRRAASAGSQHARTLADSPQRPHCLIAMGRCMLAHSPSCSRHAGS